MSIEHLSEEVDLFFSAKGLAKLHTFNLTDAFAVDYLRDLQRNTLTKICTTELIRDQRDPQWATVCTTEYLFECVQELVVRVYQEEGGRPLIDESVHSLIGEVHFRLADLIRANSQKLSLSLEREGASATQGTLEVRAEARASSRDMFVVSFAGSKLAAKNGFFGRSDPYLVISRCNEDGSYSVVWRSVRIDNELNPEWAQVKIPMSTLCNCDIDRPLRIEIFDYEENGAHQTMGMVETSVREMVSSPGAPMSVVETGKKGKKGYTNSGTLQANSCIVEDSPAELQASAEGDSTSSQNDGFHEDDRMTLEVDGSCLDDDNSTILQANGCFVEANPTSFMDYITGGLEISLSVAMDFTASNGEMRIPGTLHYLDPTGKTLNQYEEAILAVGNVLEPYDSDQRYPVCGFGARCKQADGKFTPVQHCFPMCEGAFEAHGIPGILKAYRDMLPNVILSGPTLFAPLIRNAIAHATALNCSQSNQKYLVLLILTDGVINDMEATKAAIVQASALPISIIIVGLGEADFKDMQVLDGDDQLLQAGSAVAQRDIVQFVSYKEAAAGGASLLAQQVLAEVPTQVLQYMEKNNIKANPKK